MHQERIRSCPAWRGKKPRYDTVFVTVDEEQPGMEGMEIARTRLLFSFAHGDKEYSCALVEWFVCRGDEPDPDVGMWVVHPEILRTGERTLEVIHLDSIVRSAHLLPVFGTRPVPENFDYYDTLDYFSSFYVNKYSDHHAFELLSCNILGTTDPDEY